MDEFLAELQCLAQLVGGIDGVHICIWIATCQAAYLSIIHNVHNDLGATSNPGTCHYDRYQGTRVISYHICTMSMCRH